MALDISYRGDKRVQSLDEILQKFSIFSPYYGLYLVLVIFANMMNSLRGVNYVFVTDAVNHSCKTNTNNSNWNISEPCTDWLYDDPNSFVAEFDLAGEDWKRTLVGSAHSFGYMIGLFLIGPLSDRIGRKTTAIISGLVSGAIGFAKSFSPGYWLYIALEVIEAILGDFHSPVYLMGIETMSTKHRMPFAIITVLGYCFGGMLMPVIAWLIPYWRSYLRVIYASSLVFFLYIFLLDESPRWLISVGKYQEAKKIINKISRWNNVDIKHYELQVTNCDKEEDVTYSKLLRNTISSKQLFKRFCVCVVWWITCTFVDYGLILNSVSLQGDKYWNFGLFSSVDLPTTVFKIFILKYVNRKVSLISSFCIGAVLCLIQPFMPNGMPWLPITISLAGKMMSSFFFDITYLYTSELFPTYTRNSMHSLCSAVGRIGSILAPQTPLLISYWAGLPSIIFGCTALFAGMLTLLVPDTTLTSMPDTVKEAEALDTNVTSEVESTTGAEREIYRCCVNPSQD